MYDLGLGVKAFKDALEGRDSLFTVNEKAVELNKKKSRKNTIKETNEPEVKKSKLKKL